MWTGMDAPNTEDATSRSSESEGEERVVYKRWSEAEILTQMGVPYDSLLGVEEAIQVDDVFTFYSENMKHKSSSCLTSVRKIMREMSDSSSKLRTYIREKGCPPFDRPFNLNMNLITLREVFKDFERNSNDRGNGWYSCTPLNIVLFYQVFKITGKKAWKEYKKAKVQESTPAKRKRHASRSKSSSVVYMITNPNEVNKAGKFKRYIGRTSCLERRVRQHISPSSGCRLLKNAIGRHGFYGSSRSHPMQYEILVAGGMEDMKYCETMLIQQYNTLAPNGYNMKVGDTFDFPTSTLASKPDVVTFKDLPTHFQIEAQRLVLHKVRGILLEEGEEEREFLSIYA